MAVPDESRIMSPRQVQEREETNLRLSSGKLLRSSAEVFFCCNMPRDQGNRRINHIWILILPNPGIGISSSYKTYWTYEKGFICTHRFSSDLFRMAVVTMNMSKCNFAYKTAIGFKFLSIR